MLDIFNILLVCLTISVGLENNPYDICEKKEGEPSVFLESLVGKWQGYAIITPLGKMSYDLHFKRLEENKIIGRSYTNGQAIHTWIFESGAEGKLTLDFHSTFGDSWAKGLFVTEADERKGYLFSKGNPPQLKVWVNPVVKDEIRIEIFLREQLHVSIVTSRVKP